VPTLLALFGSKAGLRLPLEGALVVGRASSADVQLTDAKASREHCRFLVLPDHVAVEDLGSQNGTFVNGQLIQARTALTAGDEIAVGDSLFVLDPDLDVLAARYGEATVCLSPSEREPGAIRARSGGQEGEGPAPDVPAPSALPRLRELADRLGAAAGGEEVARALLSAVVAAFAPDRAFVLADDGAGGIRPLCGHSRAAVVAISRTALELVRRERRALLLDDAVSDRELHKARSVLRHGLRSVMVAPLQAGADLRGFLHLDRDGTGAYGPGDLELLNAMAAVAALVIGGAAARAPAPSVPLADDEQGRLVGQAPAFREALRLMAAAARVDSSVLITGDSGTGKEELARALHGRSRRAGRAFVAVNCGAIPEALAESALFGHQKGAFTGAIANQEGYFEAADGGTLFLDEVAELAPAVQAKLLRALQERLFFRLGSTSARRADVRVVAATHRDLEREVAAGRFREDLFFRLNVLRIPLPPLRDRPEDLPALARALLERIANRLGRRCPALDASAERALGRWRWPGNARELGNVLERLLVLREPDDPSAIDAAEVHAALGRDPVDSAGGAGAGGPADEAPLAEKIAHLERKEIEAALRRARGVKSHAARALGLSRPTLDKKIAELGIDIWGEV
jgi:transcriptional regulator with GAF, ATPase, and Fis domain